AGSQVLLLDRNTFSEGRFLVFDLDEAFSRKEKSTFNQIAAFLSAETLCPHDESEEVLLDQLAEQSHRIAHGVTEHLQFAVHEAIEALVNEWARDRVENQKRPLFKMQSDEWPDYERPVQIDLPQLADGEYEITAEQLKREGLTFVYRLLFCFFAEAHSRELAILPIDEDTYRQGYSLEALRELEQVPLTPTTEEGTYFHQHLRKLFALIHEGFYPQQSQEPNRQLPFECSRETVRSFTMQPLTATLFAPESTPLLSRARFSNRCLQMVIRKLSLNKNGKTKTNRRVNFAELDINQLGAVYEGLLSYQGRFADRELIHVKPAKGDFKDKKTPTWFVPRERLDEFQLNEVERLDNSQPRIFQQ
ncbi:MAG: hypothetical protein KDA84_26645, partial [Planctomycetaceae bacterium]|nr:hypothetical protein [Planctomycetaceae bacterium]